MKVMVTQIVIGALRTIFKVWKMAGGIRDLGKDRDYTDRNNAKIG